MPELPDDVAAGLVRGIGAYVRDLAPHELPPELRRFRSFRPQALNAHRKTLLAVLDDDATRARIGHWLDNEKHPLSKEDARVLSLATTRPDGWEDELRGASKGKPEQPRRKPTDEARVDAEREKTRRAKDDLKKAREELRALQQESRARIRELQSEVAELQKRVAAAERAATTARKDADRAVENATRSQRRSKSAVEKAQADRDDARKEAKELRKKLGAANAEAAKPERPAPPRKKTPPTKAKQRKSLRVPKGRLENDPATLESWLARDDVRLLVDGYNVAKADGGYEDLQLESQRERLVDALFTLAKMTGTETIVVFDAQRVPGRRTRRTRRPVVIEWSNPGQIADDYIVSKLEALPAEPVVLVTNDKELQERGRALAATIATSQQLLALLR